MEMASSRRVIKVTSSDGRSFEVEMAVAVQSEMIKNLIEADPALDTVSLQNVTGRILEKVIEHCVNHADDPASLKAWDDYIATVDIDTLYDLVRAADYLKIKSLVYLTCKAVLEFITPEASMEIRRVFNIPFPLITPPEYDEVRRENEWSFD